MFEAEEYVVRQRLTAEGTRYRVVEDGEVTLAWTKRKYDLGEEFLLRSAGGEPVLRVTRERVGDPAVPRRSLALTFTVVDERAGEVLGLVRRDWRSLLRRHWTLLDPQGIEFAGVEARSRLLAMFRQQFTTLVPYWYRIESAGGADLGSLRGVVSLHHGFRLALADADGTLDPRLALAASVVVDAVETT